MGQFAYNTGRLSRVATTLTGWVAFLAAHLLSAETTKSFTLKLMLLSVARVLP